MAVNPSHACGTLGFAETDAKQGFEKQYSATGLKLVKTRYTWIIHGFSLHSTDKKVPLKSPIIFAGPNDKYKWQLKVYPNGESEKSDGHLSVFLSLMSETCDVNAKCTFSVLNANKGHTIERTFSDVHKFSKNDESEFGWGKMMERKTVLSADSGFLTNDKLIIVCDITIVESVEEIPVAHDSLVEETFVKVPECRLIHDFGDFFESPKLCDVTLIAACGKEIEAHKAILAARSPVFLAMFTHDTLDQQRSRVEIADVTYPVLEEVLRFIYSGKVRDIEKMADGLLAAADKYQLDRLKALCETELCNNLTIENAVSHLVLADLHGCRHLKGRAVNFICTHTKQVLETTSYKTMREN